MSPEDPLARPRRVACPSCGKQTLYTTDNPTRPFCSPRCRSVDLGAWANEDYKLASRNKPDDDPADAAETPAH